MDWAELLALLPAPHTVTIRPWLGAGAHGDRLGDPVVVVGVVDQARKLVRAGDGSQVVASAIVLAPPGTQAPPRSVVTLPDGRDALVIAVAVRDGAGLPVPDHVEISVE